MTFLILQNDAPLQCVLLLESTLAYDDENGFLISLLTDQLKSVMEQVLDFAVRELTKIVEASFDDLLLEITKMEREQQVLQERLIKSSHIGGGGVGEKGRGGSGGRRRGSENDSVSPSGSEDAREEPTKVTVPKEKTETDGE